MARIYFVSLNVTGSNPSLKNVYLGTCLFVFFSKCSLFKTHIRLKKKKHLPSILSIELENETCLLVNKDSGQSWWVGLEGQSL